MIQNKRLVLHGTVRPVPLICLRESFKHTDEQTDLNLDLPEVSNPLFSDSHTSCSAVALVYSPSKSSSWVSTPANIFSRDRERLWSHLVKRLGIHFTRMPFSVSIPFPNSQGTPFYVDILKWVCIVIWDIQWYGTGAETIWRWCCNSHCPVGSNFQ